jgi:phospholipase C
MSRRRFLQGAAVSALAVGALGSSSLPRGRLSRASALARASGPGPGTRPNPALPEGVDTMPQVEHVIIYMQENRSFDHYFGMLGRGDGFTLDGAGVPTNANPDNDGNPVVVSHAGELCDTAPGASQSWNATHVSMNGGAMDGFIRAGDGAPGSMQYYDGTDLPFYYGLASTFPLCDRWFTSVPCQTYPNRRYLQAATSVGIVDTDIDEVIATPVAPNGVIWERLNDHGISWNDYAYDLADIILFPTFGLAHSDRIKTINDFLVDCARGTLPQVSIVSPGHTAYSEETPADVQNGEAYSAALINAVMHGPAWDKTVMFFTYDEHGGYYDHVTPPPAIAPDDIAPRIDVPPDEAGTFDEYGPRVPGFVISPFAKADYVSHVVHDHTSILKFIETKFNLGALTYRDANASDLLDTLDFANPGFRTPPELPTPGLPRSGSVCEPLPYPQTEPIFDAEPAEPTAAGPTFTG